MRRPGFGALRRPGFRGLGGSTGGGGLPPLASLDVLAPELLLDERGLTVGTGYSAWANQGTAGGNATQGTAGKQPGTARTINGLAAPDFDGTDDSMLTSLAASAYMTTTQFEFAIVCQIDALPATAPPAANVWYNSPSVINTVTSSAFGLPLTQYGIRSGTGNSPYAVGPYMPLYADGLPHLIQMRLVGGSVYMSIDNAEERTMSLGAATTLTAGIRLGANFADTAFANCAIATVFCRKTVLTATEREQVRDFLISKYAIEGTRKYDFIWGGNSITIATSAAGAQWRGRVQSQAPALFRATGRFSNAGVAFPQDMSVSASGATCPTLQALFGTVSGGTLIQGDIIPLLIGTNDIGVDAVSNATLSTRYLSLLGELNTRFPGKLVVAQKLLPRTDGGGVPGAQVADWNANFHDAMVASAQGLGYNVISDDTLSTLGGITYLDGLHPDFASTNVIGDALAARVSVWAAAA